MNIILVKPEKDILEYLTSGPKSKDTIKNNMFIDRLKEQGFITYVVNEGKSGFIALTDLGLRILNSNKNKNYVTLSQPYVSLCDEFKGAQSEIIKTN